MSDPMKSGYSQKQRRKDDAKKHYEQQESSKNFIVQGEIHRD